MGENVSEFGRGRAGAACGARRSVSCFRATTSSGPRPRWRTSRCPRSTRGCQRETRNARAKALLGSLGLGDRLQHRPSQLSGGQQQRVSVARALMNGGRIVLADEPTGALDSKSGTEVMALLQDLVAPRAYGHPYYARTRHCRAGAAHIEIRDGTIVSDPGRSCPCSRRRCPMRHSRRMKAVRRCSAARSRRRRPRCGRCAPICFRTMLTLLAS